MIFEVILLIGEVILLTVIVGAELLFFYVVYKVFECYSEAFSN